MQTSWRCERRLLTWPGCEQACAQADAGRGAPERHAGRDRLLPLQRRLCGIAKTGLLPAKGTEILHINITVDSLTLADELGALVSMPGKYSIILSRGTVGAEEITVPLTLEGERLVLETLPPGI